MDFMQRGTRPNQPVNQTATSAADPAHEHGKGRRRGFAWLRFTSVVLLFSITVLVIAIMLLLVFGGPTNESKFVNNTKYQAVFLNGGQVYFGKIRDMNNKYMRMQDIYYLRVNQQVQPDGTQDNSKNNDVSLVKLGCELHGPQDQMVINREQIIFWENLKDDGQVAKAVATYKQQNPNGQDCTTNTNSTKTDTGNSQQ